MGEGLNAGALERACVDSGDRRVEPCATGGRRFCPGTTRPLSASTMMLIGHTIAYFISGIVLVVALDRIVEFIENPEPWHYGVSGLVARFWFGFSFNRRDRT